MIHQTYQNLEILIIDDGSTDGSGKVCDEYKMDPRVRVIHQDNLGLSEARNTGLRFRTGEYVAFLDSDDAFVPDAIEKALRYFENVDTDIVSYGFTSLRTEGTLKTENRKEQEVYVLIPPAGQYEPNDCLRMLLQGKLCIAIWSMISRTSLWKDIHFPQGHTYEDSYVTPGIIIRARSIISLPEILVLNRRRKGSITQTFTEKNMRDCLRANHYWNDFIMDRTPNILDRTMIARIKGNEISLLVKQFCISKESSFKKELRQNILSLVQTTGYTNLRFPTQIQYLGIRFIPHFFSRIYYSFVLRQDIE